MFTDEITCSLSLCAYFAVFRLGVRVLEEKTETNEKKTSHVHTENVFVYVFVCAKSMAYVFRTNALFVSSSSFRIEFVELP